MVSHAGAIFGLRKGRTTEGKSSPPDLRAFTPYLFTVQKMWLISFAHIE